MSLMSLHLGLDVLVGYTRGENFQVADLADVADGTWPASRCRGYAALDSLGSLGDMKCRNVR